MAIEQVKAFYERLLSDTAFYKQLQVSANKAECSKIVKLAGYSFTETEFEAYTAQLLSKNISGEHQHESVDEKELETILGGASRLIQESIPMPPYGHSPELFVNL
jgi:predicted ribosomally synthesized peptide with nif11-like leader